MTIFYCLSFETGESGLRIYIPQEQGSLVIPSGTGFPFRRLRRLAGLRWGYSNPPPRGYSSSCHSLSRNGSLSLLHSLSTDRTENVSSIIVCSIVAGETRCPQSCSLAAAVVLLPVYTAVTWQWVYMLQYYRYIRKLLSTLSVWTYVLTVLFILFSSSICHFFHFF
jgi:hypothetical protein